MFLLYTRNLTCIYKLTSLPVYRNVLHLYISYYATVKKTSKVPKIQNIPILNINEEYYTIKILESRM